MKGLLLLLLLLLPQVTLTQEDRPYEYAAVKVPSAAVIPGLVEYAQIIAKVRVKDAKSVSGRDQEVDVEFLCLMKGAESLSPTIKVIVRKNTETDNTSVEKNKEYILFLQIKKNDTIEPYYLACERPVTDEEDVRNNLNLTSDECVQQPKSQSGCADNRDKQPRPALQGYAIIRHGEKALCSAALITGDWLIASAHCVKKHDSKQLTADIGSKRVDIKLTKIKRNRNLALLRLRPGLPNPDTIKLPMADDGAITSSTSCVAIGRNQRSRTVTSTRPHSTRRLVLFCSETCGAAPAEEAIIACYDGKAWVVRGVQATGDYGCDDGGSSFTRLAFSPTLDWIKKVTGAKD